jgi:hypothetical protein
VGPVRLKLGVDLMERVLEHIDYLAPLISSSI